MHPSLLVLFAWLALVGAAHAGEFRFQVLIDLDQDAQTGCSAAADADGSEWRLLVLTDRHSIIESRVESCGQGVWRVEQHDRLPRELGLGLGSNGGDMIRWSIPRHWFELSRQLPLRVSVERLDIPANDRLDANGEWLTLMLALPGEPHTIPTLGVGGLILLAAAFVLLACRRRGSHRPDALHVGILLLPTAIVLVALSDPTALARVDSEPRFEVNAADAHHDAADPGADILAFEARVEGESIELEVEVRNIETEPAVAPLRVLLIGNSLTYSNDLPAMLMAIAAQTGKTLHADSLALPNASLQEHFEGSQVRSLLSDGRYRWVIMQQGPSSLLESQIHLRHWAARMDPLIRIAGSRPALFMVWPDASRISFFDAVRHAYSNAALQIDGMFIPAGEAWRAGWRLNPRLPLYSADSFHPSPLGSYAAALSIYAALYQESPLGLPAQLTLADGQTHRFSTADVRDAQMAAWSAHQQYWRPGK